MACQAFTTDRSLLYLGLAGLGLVVRVVIAAVSTGSNDAQAFLDFGQGVLEQGVIWMYQNVPLFNHPPVVAEWSALAFALHRDLGWPFFFVFKVPVILADVGTMLLLWSIARPRGRGTAALLVLAFAWSLDSILVTGYHCNTDSIYAFFCLLAVWLIEKRQISFWGGAALAAAINIKLLPGLLILPLALSFRDVRSIFRFGAGLVLGVVPFIPGLFSGYAFLWTAVSYNSNLDYWGINCLLLWGQQLAPGSSIVSGLLDQFLENGRVLILGLVAILSVVARRTGWWNRYELCCLCLAIFLILAPGFGVQYTVIILPLFFAVSIRWASIYSLLAGVFLFIIYFHFWTGDRTLYSFFIGEFPRSSHLVGLATWGTLIAWAGVNLWQVSRRRSDPTSRNQFQQAR